MSYAALDPVRLSPFTTLPGVTRRGEPMTCRVNEVLAARVREARRTRDAHEVPDCGPLRVFRDWMDRGGTRSW